MPKKRPDTDTTVPHSPAVPPPLPCEYLNWDSEFFGARIGRVTLKGPLADSDFQAIESWADAHAIDCTYLLQDADDTSGIIRAENHGFRLTDVRMLYECSHVNSGKSPESSATIRPLRDSDVPVLVELASRSHRQTRFYGDPHFSRDRCDEMYRVWIRRSCSGWADHVVVAEIDGRPCGYMTIHIDGPNVGRMTLLAVDDAVRNRGVGSLIVHASLEWLESQGISRSTWPTSVRNVGAQRLCSKWGFALVSVETWHHRWRESARMGLPTG